MGILFKFFQQARTWDKPTQAAMLIAVGLLVVALLTLTLGPDAVRDPALMGVVGLTLAMQVIALWGNRHMVTPYTQAQRHFIAGEFEAARDTLLPLLQQDKAPDVDVYVLLGNTYRQLGDIAESERLLTKALQKQPAYHFASYGFGRTLLATGAYADAADAIANALQQGAPEIVRFDLGHARYRMGDADGARAALQKVVIADEPHRQLMQAYLLYQLGAAPAPDADLVAAGLPFWQAEAARYPKTAYGQALMRDIQMMQEGRTQWDS